MGDPLSVAGSAVGIISLGIQVCQGLIQYADAIRGQQRDVDDGMDEVRSLLAVFKSLKQTIARIETDSPENAKSLLEHLRQAEAKLQSLQEVLTEVGIPVNTSSSIKGKMKETYRAAIYPMKKSKLEGAHQNVQSILGILTTALQTVDLDLGVSHSDSLKALQSSTTSNARELKVAIEANSSQLGGLEATSQREFSNLNSSLVLARAEVQDFSSRSTSQLESVSVDVKENLESTRLLVKMIGDLSLQINASAGSHNQNALLLAKLGPRVPPSSLKQACDLSATNADLIPRSSRGIDEPLQPRHRRRYCKCPPRPKRRDDFLSRYSRGAYFEHTTVSEHDVGCPFAKFARQSSTTKAGAGFHLRLRNIFSALVDVSICLTTGAGGFSLSPSLRYVHVYDGRSPVSQLIRDCTDPEIRSVFGGQQENLVDRLRHMRRQITMCFEQGIASPHDITTDFYSQSWMWLINFVPRFYMLDRYEEEAIGFALDTAQWLADASAPEMAENISHWLFLKPLRWWRNSLSKLPDDCRRNAIVFDFFRRLLDILEPDDECLIEVILTLYPALDYISPLLRSRIPCKLEGSTYATSTLSLTAQALDVSPMALAILSRSMSDLEDQLKLAPTSVLERTYSCTTLQLASAWPQGFMRLMQTDARTLLHEPMRGGNLLAPRSTFGFDPYWHPSTLETLLDAGYTLFPDNKYITLQLLLNECTDAIAQIIAKHLSQRLRQLSELAAKFGITSNNDSSIPDFDTAARWCLSLEELGESVDPSIRVPKSEDMVTTIYHFWEMPLHLFPIFYAYGFIHVNACDHKGLPPLFVRFEIFWNGEEEYFLSQRVPNDYPEVFHNLPWLRKHGLLGQKPHDPLGLGLNIDATGAHRVAAEIGSKFYLNLGDQQDVDHYLSLVTDLLRQFSGDSYRDLDKCACWCNSDGGGCSPIKLLYKSLAHPTQRYCGIWVFTRNEFQAASITRLLFDFDIFEVPTATPTAGVEQLRERDETTNAQPSTRALELVRLLTFEALEMTHTCCMLEELAEIDHDFRVILKCNPNTVSDIRQSEAEQRNAVQLDTLMKDFTNVMQQDYHAKSLLDFVFSYWKTRVEDLYAVREDEVQKMQRHVSNVRTGIWPRPLRRLLWPRRGGYWEDEDSTKNGEEIDSDEDGNDDEHQGREDRD